MRVIATILCFLASGSHASCLMTLKPENITVTYEKHPYIEGDVKIKASLPTIIKLRERNGDSIKVVRIDMDSKSPRFSAELAITENNGNSEVVFSIGKDTTYDELWIIATAEPQFEYQRTDDCNLIYYIRKKLK